MNGAKISYEAKNISKSANETKTHARNKQNNFFSCCKLWYFFFSISTFFENMKKKKSFIRTTKLSLAVEAAILNLKNTFRIFFEFKLLGIYQLLTNY